MSICWFLVLQENKTYSLDSHLGKDEFTLERFSLSFPSPDTQNERNLWPIFRKRKIQPKHFCPSNNFKLATFLTPELYKQSRKYILIDVSVKTLDSACVCVCVYLDAGKAHEVLGDVNNQFVHESRSNVQTTHVVVDVIPN